jgi:hypothetical protein
MENTRQALIDRMRAINDTLSKLGDHKLGPEQHKKILEARVCVMHLETAIALLDPATTPEERVALGLKLVQYERMLRSLL